MASALDDAMLGKLAIIVTECATNQLKHAQRGELLVRPIVRAVDGRLGAARHVTALNCSQ